MDISGLSNSYIASESARLNRNEEKVNSFQSILNSAAKSGDDKELMEACVEFESYFLQIMYKEMRKTTAIGPTAMPKSQTESIFQEMLDEEYSKNSAKMGGIGLATMMYKQMKRNVEEA